MLKFIIPYVVFISILYWYIGFKKIKEILMMFFDKTYWVNYNIIEFAAWMAKAIIIIPGLVFGIELWYFHFLTLITSSMLIWASMKKKLPTLITFNTIWIMISLTIIIRNLWRIFGL
jgi:hypothetical protein